MEKLMKGKGIMIGGHGMNRDGLVRVMVIQSTGGNEGDDTGNRG